MLDANDPLRQKCDELWKRERAITPRAEKVVQLIEETIPFKNSLKLETSVACRKLGDTITVFYDRLAPMFFSFGAWCNDPAVDRNQLQSTLQIIENVLSQLEQATNDALAKLKTDLSSIIQITIV